MFIIKSFQLIMPWLKHEMGMLFDFLVILMIFIIYLPFSQKKTIVEIKKIT
jgi:hypothetical protein